MHSINLESDSDKHISKTGLSLLAVTGVAALALTVGCVPFISPALRRICLPYVPATDAQICNILKVLSQQRKGKLLDVGSGDGRLVIAAAKQGFSADGIELNPWLVLYSKWKAFRNGAHKNTHFYYGDLWNFNMSSYNHVVVFGVGEMMPEIEAKFSQELSPNAAIIACRFPLPSKRPVASYGTGIDTVWVYSNLNNDND